MENLSKFKSMVAANKAQRQSARAERFLNNPLIQKARAEGLSAVADGTAAPDRMNIRDAMKMWADRRKRGG